VNIKHERRASYHSAITHNSYQIYLMRWDFQPILRFQHLIILAQPSPVLNKSYL